MKKLAAIAVSIGVIIVIVGLILVGIYGRDKIASGELFSFGSVNLSSANGGEDINSDELEGLQEIKVNVSAYAVYVLKSNTDVLSVKYVTPLEDDVDIHVSPLQDGVLSITQTDSLSHIHWGFNWFVNRRFIAIYVPQTEAFAQVKLSITANYSSVKINGMTLSAVDVSTDAGSVNVDDVIVDSHLSVSTSAGSVKVEDVRAQQVELSSSAGSVKANDIECESFKVSTDAGSVKTTDIDATAYSEIKVGAGSVKCEINTAKLTIDSGAGSIKFETNAANIELSSGAGSIAGTVNGRKSEYAIEVKQDMGSSNISNQHVAGAAKSLKVVSDMGSIKIKFEND